MFSKFKRKNIKSLDELGIQLDRKVSIKREREDFKDDTGFISSITVYSKKFLNKDCFSISTDSGGILVSITYNGKNFIERNDKIIEIKFID